ncbi:3-hydroxyacyl-CoA dehydrogenase family protein [Metabacillus sediminilitoris]|uniref:3-hydroxyacyl-CoA dehydrogenase n=1 Tax=Metabacillus sediminilitoris TaxID=2567941 RepID=A0A4S4BQZ3_9BACI|nr:3-hydroxyacyl-CoA dehydrogenase NAD-binding domain-containing protein [Metabacillus sediminilitoris]QGQ45653.1 3-hydroxyacyl-CoA dehydrogenase [Metabacillus sediminilitoris]THF77228.1 3-hydroxyacyl-CoA dehydrogenase [Metabacillus sediminilitoris]
MTKIAIIGSGTMGRGIAYVAALNGFSVALNDIHSESLKQAENYIKEELIKSEERGYISKDDIERSMNNLTFSLDMNACVEDSELVIEAVLEIMDMKINVFKELDRLCPDYTILATNTSTMSPTEIGAQTSRPDKVIAMHFFNPVHKMKLIEIVKGLDTSKETMEFVKNIGKKMGKETVEVNEFPGFITSRMNCLIGNEAMNMLMEGVASAEDIDKSIKLGLNHPMGPLALADLVGLDTRLRNMEYLHQTLGEKYRPCPLLTKYVKAGKLGVKSGSGFFNYSL